MPTVRLWNNLKTNKESLFVEYSFVSPSRSWHKWAKFPYLSKFELNDFFAALCIAFSKSQLIEMGISM